MLLTKYARYLPDHTHSMLQAMMQHPFITDLTWDDAFVSAVGCCRTQPAKMQSILLVYLWLTTAAGDQSHESVGH